MPTCSAAVLVFSSALLQFAVELSRCQDCEFMSLTTTTKRVIGGTLNREVVLTNSSLLYKNITCIGCV